MDDPIQQQADIALGLHVKWLPAVCGHLPVLGVEREGGGRL